MIARCRGGEERAFREIYLLYSKSMYNLCLRMLNSKEESKDVLQESFISAFNKIKELKEPVLFGPWLKRIVINKCIDAIRKRDPNLLSLSADEAVCEEEFEGQNEDHTVNEIREAMQLLAEGYRVILTLFLLEEHTHAMIAEKLKISEGTSKSQYARGRKKLAELLKKKKSHER